MMIQRYFEEDCLTSLPGERPYAIYILVRVYKTWETKKGLKREKWEQKLYCVRGRTPREAARKMVHFIERKELLPFSVAGSEADELRRELAEIEAQREAENDRL